MWRFGLVVSSAAARLLLKTHKCLHSRAREGKNWKCIPQRASPTYSVAFVIVERLWRRRESDIPACIHEEQFRPANKQQRDTETLLGGIKQPDISGTDLIPA